MLICNVSQRPVGSQIAADIAEIATAVDASASGFAVFSTLVDDPASVRDTVNAFLGDIMVEAASASDNVLTGLVYIVAVDEGAHAVDTNDGILIYIVAVVEGATAADTNDGTIVAAGVTRQAMVAGQMLAFVNSDGSREAYVPGVMIN
jgi:hypothetical protein